MLLGLAGNCFKSLNYIKKYIESNWVRSPFFELFYIIKNTIVTNQKKKFFWECNIDILLSIKSQYLFDPNVCQTIYYALLNTYKQEKPW